MIRSLAVILLPVLLLTMLFTRNLESAPVTVVDWRPVLAQAREQSPYPVLAPTNLPPEWRSTQVRWVKQGDPYLDGAAAVRNTWQLGFLAPDDTYVALNQGDARPADFIAAQSRDGLPDGQSSIEGATWQRLRTEDGRTRSLVLGTPQVTTLVVGDTSYEALESFATTLRDS
jgi:hypothetical protein